MALELREIYHVLSVFRSFFSLLPGIHLIFGTLLVMPRSSFKFGLDPLIFPEVMALGT
jgi:hypothetical protein